MIVHTPTFFQETHYFTQEILIQSTFQPGASYNCNDIVNKILNYVIFIGACGLTIICVIPFIFNGVFGASVSFGGTSLIIIVSVVLETIKQIESLMLVRNYKGFLND